jgi:hypothetical protein
MWTLKRSISPIAWFQLSVKGNYETLIITNDLPGFGSISGAGSAIIDEFGAYQWALRLSAYGASRWE